MNISSCKIYDLTRETLFADARASQKIWEEKYYVSSVWPKMSKVVWNTSHCEVFHWQWVRCLGSLSTGSRFVFVYREIYAGQAKFTTIVREVQL